MRSHFLLLTILLISLISALALNEEESNNNGTKESLLENKAVQFVKIKDDLNRTIYLRGIPERIVSLAPSNTEMLFALGAGDKVVGVTSYCDYPPEAREKEIVGGFLDLNLEKIVSLNPDLVLAFGDLQLEYVNRLEELGFKVVVFNPKDLNGIYRNILTLGKILGREEKAVEIISEMKGEITKLRKKEIKERKVLVLLSWEPLYVVGKGTFLDNLLEELGIENLAEEKGYYVMSPEELISIDPPVILFLGGRETTESPLREKLTAFREGKVFYLDPDLTTRPGPRIVLGAKEIAKALDP